MHQSGVAKLVEQAGLDWSSLLASASEVVVFGSRAAGVELEDSDLDLLVVGAEMRFPRPLKSAGIDLVYQSEAEIVSEQWLCSELAGHIAVYGQWLHGSGEWREAAVRGLRSGLAAEAKHLRIGRLSASVERHWERLSPGLRTCNLLTLERERLRLGFLKRGVAVPPTRLLRVA